MRHRGAAERATRNAGVDRPWARPCFLTTGCRVPYPAGHQLIPGAGGNKPPAAPVEPANGPAGGPRISRSLPMSIDLNMERRGFLKCMTWAGTAMVWTVAGGVPRSRLIGTADAATGDFTFV